MKASGSPAYRPDIDGLRAFAVLSVLAYHGFPSLLPGGFAGVDVFFVISGYLISGIILREVSEGTFSLGTFYARRVRRIFPALILVLTTSLTLGWMILLAGEYRQLGKHAAAAVGFGLNLVLNAEAGYFDTQSDYKILLHLWSLGVEEQYYIVWPLVALALARWRGALFGFVAAAIVVSFAYNVLRVTNHQSSTFFLPFSRAWELLLGGLLAFAEQGRGRAGLRGPALSELAGWGGLVLAVAAVGLLHAGLRFPGWYAALPAGGAALLILAGPNSFVSRRIFSHPAAVAIGLVSYPLYLWHWPLLTYARIVEGGQPPASTVLAALAASGGLAWLTYRYVERPIRLGRVRAVPALVAAAAILGAAGGAIYLANGIPGRKPHLEAFEDLEGRFEAFRKTTIPCAGALAPSRPLTWCQTAGSGPVTAALLGDSHADHLFPGLVRADPNRGWLLVGQTSCPPALGIVAGLKGSPEVCSEAVPAALDVILRTHAIQTVVVAFLGPYYVSETGLAANHVGTWSPSNYSLKAADGEKGGKRAVLQAGLIRTVRALTSAGKTVVLAADIPEMPFYPVQCVPRFPSRPPTTDCSLTVRQVQERQSEYRSMLDAVAAAVPGVRIFDPLPFLCGSDRCMMVREGVPLYRDPHHLSLEGTTMLAPHLLRTLDRLL